MALLNDLGRSLHCFRHAQSCHDNWQSTTAECGDGDILFYFGQLGCRSRGWEDSHIVEFLEEKALVLEAEGGVWWEGGETMGELL